MEHLLCWEATETMEHLFLFCPVARALWDLSGLEFLGQGLPRHTFPLFLRRVMGLIHRPELFMALAAILWRIWRSRNWVVFEGKQFGIEALMRQFHQQYEEWVNLPIDRVGTPHRQTICPGAPSADLSVVCCWDGATRRGASSAGGMVLMNGTREVLLARGIQFPGLVDPMVIELLTLREAINWCLGLGIH
ncbi:unnamed protein product [Linum trigynum]|uniref:Reverse transcriptase zinc-binding domain-containing protein n=1 Tax=Linum trigynum TaxID=586398 RepID=A0AAV2FRH2_9ROSI